MNPPTLGTLFETLPDARLSPGAATLRIHHVRDDSRLVERGDLFVAVPGTRSNGADYVAEAVRRGAAAIVLQSDAHFSVPSLPPDAAGAETSAGSSPAGVPVVRVPDARLALAVLAAAAAGRPAKDLTLVGITGTVGKTSVLALLAEILDTAGIGAGTIGSLGVRVRGRPSRVTALNTTPGALAIHEALAAMRAAGVGIAAMEVTSHALVQRRVHGLAYDIGIFTNLTLLEHLEYHGSFADYARAKFRFLDHLAPDAPLVYAAGDRSVREAARRHRGPHVSCGGGRAHVSVRRDRLSLDGTRATLHVRRALPRIADPPFEPATIPIELRALGRPNIMNATLAAAAALVLGASADAVRAALARVEPPRRRLELVNRKPTVIDDTVGHPDSITAVFELVARARHRQLRVVFGIRGQRGPEINRRDAEALAIWARRVPIDALHVTLARDTADERNQVTAEERRAFMDVLDHARLPYSGHDSLRDAVAAAVDDVREEDLVLLLGAQGMDASAELVRKALYGPAPEAGRSTIR